MIRIINKILSFFGLMRIRRAERVSANLYLYFIARVFLLKEADATNCDAVIRECGKWWVKEFYGATAHSDDDDIIFIDEEAATRIFNQENAKRG